MPDRALPVRIGLFTEVGGSIGYGHWVRCSALAAALQAAGAEVVWVLHVEGELALPLPAGAYRGPWQREPHTALGAVGPLDLAVVDSYRAEQACYEALAASTHLAVLDDYDRMPYPAGLLINPNPAAEEVDYSEQAAEVVGGAAWVMLRPALVDARQGADPPAARTAHAVERLVVTLGGADVHRLAESVARCAQTVYPDADLHVVAGSEAYASDLREKLPTAVVHGYLDAAPFAALLLRSHLAVSAGGQTLHELACLGVPMVALGTGMDQLPNLRSYVRRGLLDDLLTWEQPDLIAGLAAHLRALRPAGRRRARAEQVQAFIDGRGAERVARRLLAWISG